MCVTTRFQSKLASLIELAGGNIEEDIFVTRPGVAVLNETEVTDAGSAIYNALNIDMSRPTYEQRAEFKSRLTYLSFADTVQDSSQYNERMTKVHQHLSVHSSTQIEFLLAGISLETSLEFIAHTEASVGRLTSSNTKAMDSTLYRIQGTPEQQAWQKEFITRYLTFRGDFADNRGPDLSGHNDRELWNMTNLGSKCTALTYHMSLKDFHKLFIGRLSKKGNEIEVQEVCRMMCTILHQRYPLVIGSVDEYYAMNNGEKYK